MNVVWNAYDELALNILHRNVANGAKWLDEYDPAWYNKINVGHLDVSSGSECICGQLFIDDVLLDDYGDFIYEDGYDYATNELMSQTEAYQRGFRCSDKGFFYPNDDNIFDKCATLKDPYKQYDYLGIFWVEVIRHKQFIDIVSRYDFDSYFVTV